MRITYYFISPREEVLSTIDWERGRAMIKELQELYGRTHSELVNLNQQNTKESQELQDKLVTVSIEYVYTHYVDRLL